MQHVLVPCVAYCQKDAQEQRPTAERKPKLSKPKPGKSPTKGPRAATAKVKATPAAQTQTLLTQVHKATDTTVFFLTDMIC